MTRFAEASVPSPLGPLRLVATSRGLAYCGTKGERPERFARWAARRLAGGERVGSLPALAQASAELAEYFAGERRAFTVPLDQEGTPFQRAVWERLLAIPFGQTTTYARLAADVGAPGAERAVGSANGANVISIVVPCHRVLGSDGALTGYAGGMPAKARLLKLERAALQSKLTNVNKD